MAASLTALQRMPYWPRYLSRDQAAAYVGVSVNTFEQEVEQEKWPPGKPRGPKGGRITWDRKLIDLYADRDSGIDAAGDGATPSPPDPWLERWSRGERRA